MDKLKQHFIHDSNCEYIINSVIDNIKNRLNITLTYNENFFNVFNNISSNVFSVESARSNLGQINAIVIREIIKYILKNIAKFDIEEPTEIEKNTRTNDFFTERKKQDDKNIPSNEQSQKKEEQLTVSPKNIEFTEPILNPSKKIIIHLDSITKDVLLDNVTGIKLLYADIPNSDYIINETNNEFIFRNNYSTDEKTLYSDVHNVFITPGNYTPEQLLYNLEKEINVIDKDFQCSYNDITGGSVISNNNCKFDILECSLLYNIGFLYSPDLSYNYLYISTYPVQTVKKRYIDLNVYINESENIFKERLYFDKDMLYTKKTFDLMKKYNKSVYINDVYIEFVDYNFRNFPFNIDIELIHN
jgi:hypothetical protein